MNAPGVYAVQVGAFRERGNAERMRAQMAAKYGAARIVRAGSRALAGAGGRGDDRGGRRRLPVKIRQDSGEKNAFVVRLDS